MSQEITRGFTRILINYIRLIITLALGISVVPLAINWLGDNAFGIISLLGANIGLASIFSQIVKMSLVRELGQAYHSDNETFRKCYAAICGISLACSGLSVITFGILYALVPVFQIPEEFIGPARWFVIGQGTYTAVIIFLSPMLNMYLVKERFIGYSAWLIGVRAANPLSLIILGYIIVIDDPALGLTLHGLTWSTLAIIAMITASWIIIFKDRRLSFTLKGADKETRKQVFSTFGWNSGVQIAMNLHEQLPPLLLNLFFGPLINAAWGIGFRFVAYIRMATTGVQFGSDAVSARLSSNADAEASRKQLQRLITSQTRLTSMIALPAAAGIFIYARPIFELWVGKHLQDYNTVMPAAVTIARILSLAILARAISDTWLLILYGAGFVHRYAKLVILGGIIAPIASLIILITVDSPNAMYAPPLMFTIIFATFHLIGLPIITGRCLHISAVKLLMGTARPALALSIALAGALGWIAHTDQFAAIGFTQTITRESAQLINPTAILVSIAIMGFVYTAASWIIVLEPADRQRVLGAFRSIRSRVF